MTAPRTAILLPPPWITVYSDKELAEAAMRHYTHDVRPRLSDALLHALAADPEFETRPTIPCPGPPSTIPAPRCPSSAPPVDADSFEDGWL